MFRASLGFRASDLGLGFRVEGSRFRIQGLGIQMQKAMGMGTPTVPQARVF